MLAAGRLNRIVLAIKVGFTKVAGIADFRVTPSGPLACSSRVTEVVFH
jgi:hypothetical protein